MEPAAAAVVLQEYSKNGRLAGNANAPSETIKYMCIFTCACMVVECSRSGAESVSMWPSWVQMVFCRERDAGTSNSIPIE